MSHSLRLCYLKPSLMEVILSIFSEIVLTSVYSYGDHHHGKRSLLFSQLRALRGTTVSLQSWQILLGTPNSDLYGMNALPLEASATSHSIRMLCTLWTISSHTSDADADVGGPTYSNSLITFIRIGDAGWHTNALSQGLIAHVIFIDRELVAANLNNMLFKKKIERLCSG